MKDLVYLVHRAFTELKVFHGINNHVKFVTHMQGASLNPILIDLPDDSKQCYQLNRVESYDHNVVLCKMSLNPTYDKGSQ